ncbi:MAG: glycosyl hydrolase [Ruminococcaceae bacterium]|nr:glycosyl hydrolase [Oscillospiraceae bacterium]
MDVKALVSQMTLEEKCSLLSGSDFWHTEPVERLGIPACMVSDGPHGLRKQDMGADHLGMNDSIEAVCMPAACATAASFDKEMIYKMGESIGSSCQHEQLSVVLGPAVNIKRSPLCGRNFEYFSEDPYLAGEMSAAFINGVQSKNVGTSIKHFAANNQEHRRMSSSSNVDERTLREIYFPAFETSVKKAQPWTVMCSYNRLNGVYASEDPWLLTEVLRDEWGFEGYVVSDWGAVSDRVEGVAAGLDLEMPASGGHNDRKVLKAVQEGILDEAVVDQAVERILRINYRYLENAKPETPWDKEADHLLSAKIAGECMVLLKNNGVLPLSKADDIAFIGEFAAKPRFQGGGSSHIHCFKTTSALEAAEGLKVTYAQGYSVKDDVATPEMIAEAVEKARNAKAAVIFAGLPDSYESEGYDRTHMGMPPCQNALIEAVAAANPNTVVVLHNGSPVEMPWADKVAAIVEAYLGGQAVGIAAVNVLFGDVNPCGKLPETFPKKLSDNPSFLYYGGEGNEADYREGIFVGYRYYDKKDMDVLFPFGHGLSYTTFAFENLRLSAEEINDTDTLTVTVTAKNTGAVPGKTVVQLYVGKGQTDQVIRPVKELKGFDKVFLNPGESKDVTFTLDKRSFAYWNDELGDWHVETGEYTVSIGHSSRDLAVCAAVKVNSTVKIPTYYTLDTIFMDLMADPEAVKALAPILDAIKKALVPGSDDKTAAASEAITEEMNLAMLNYMPLRGILSFGGGAIAPESIEAILDKLNNA